MAASSKDIEVLWRRFQTEGVKTGISVRQFFEQNGIPYHVFEKWYKKSIQQPGIVNCEVEEEPQVAPTPSHERLAPVVSSLEIVFKNGLIVQHHELSYDSLQSLIRNLETLCSA